MAVKYDSRLAGTMQGYFRIGTTPTTSVRLKNSSSALHIRDYNDSNWADVAAKSIKLQGTNASNGITIAVPAGLSANVTLTLPSDDGASGEVLYTDGAGGLYWAAPGNNAITIQSQTFNQASSSPITFFTPSDNATLLRFKVVVSSPASGGSPTLTIGNSGDNDAYVLAADNDLKTAAEYLIEETTVLGASPAAINIYLTPSGQTFSGLVVAEWAA